MAQPTKRTGALNPMEAIVVTRERVQEVLDDAVERGRMTRDDASDLLAELIAAPVDRVRRAAGRAPSFPIAGYDDMTAAQVNGRLGELGPAELRRVREHELRNANRKSVIAAIDRKLP